jgi:hypothetical protein
MNMAGLIDDMNALAFKVRFGSTTVDDVKVLDSATANIAEMRAVIGFLMGGLAAICADPDVCIFAKQIAHHTLRASNDEGKAPAK